MKRIFSIMLGFCFIAVFTSTSFAGEQLWNFDSHADGWTVANGNWSLSDGVYKLATGAQAEHSLVGETTWEDYTIETKIRLDSGNWAGIAFRAKSEMEYYVFYMNVPNNITELWRHKTGSWTARDNLKQFPGKNVKIENGKWFDMKVVVEGDSMAVWIDGELQGEHVDDSGAKYSAGQAGAWGWQTGVSFDDFKVSGDDIEGDGTPVEPLDKLATTWGHIKRDR
ncbi:MAG: DUF1080 domain-containing protein [Candidatus Poribacteria bacterium]|nr:DUF1080 domain-containing protein [Candidatus Poribacteria bacterium]